MPQVKGFIICLVINTNGHINASRQHSSLKSLSANLSVYIRYGFLATTMPLILTAHQLFLSQTSMLSKLMQKIYTSVKIHP